MNEVFKHLSETTDIGPHENDRFVYVYRVKHFLERVQPGATELFSRAQVSVGSYYASKNSAIIGTGLNLNEIDILMPIILSISNEDRDFRQSVNTFYKELFTPIPYETGLQLNIGMTVSNEKPLSKENLPINIMDYIRYRHIIAHPKTRMSKQAAENSTNAQFYIYDPLQNNEQLNATTTIQDRAISAYLELKDNEDKVDMVLTLMQIDPVRLVMNVPGNKFHVKQAELRSLANSKPKSFLDALGPDSFEERYMVNALINAGIWSTIAGGIIIDGSNNSIIGNNIIEAIAYVKSDRNSTKMTIYRSRLQDYLKKPVPTRTMNTAVLEEADVIEETKTKTAKK